MVSSPFTFAPGNGSNFEYCAPSTAARASKVFASSAVHQSRNFPVGIDLAALIVKTVRQLVTDHAADRAVVDRGIRVRIEHRRLQNSGRKNDVAQRAVVGVVRLRRHSPIGAIDRAAECDLT